MSCVSIGIPVYNGEEFIGRALDSLLAQTFRNFELIISDNASRDRTQEICLRYAAMDPRVKYYRNEMNIGAAENFNRVFALSSGTYFKWAGHDDYWTPDYLERCVNALEKNPSAILCYCQDVFYNDDGDFVCLYDTPHDVSSSKPSERFRQMLWTRSNIDLVYALFRRDALAKTRLIRNILGPDKVLARELSLIGPFCHVPMPMAIRRAHQRRDPRERLARIDPKRKVVRLALARICMEYVRLVMRAPMRLYQRAFLVIQIFWYFTSCQLRGRPRALWHRLHALVSPRTIAASHSVDGDLRLRAFRRFARKAKWAQLRAFLVSMSAEASVALWCEATRELDRRPEKAAKEMLSAWVSDPAECRRVAAVSAMMEDPSRWASVLKARLPEEPSSKIQRMLRDALAGTRQEALRGTNATPCER